MRVGFHRSMFQMRDWQEEDHLAEWLALELAEEREEEEREGEAYVATLNLGERRRPACWEEVHHAD